MQYFGAKRKNLLLIISSKKISFSFTEIISEEVYSYFYLDHHQPKVLIRHTVLPNTIQLLPGVETNFQLHQIQSRKILTTYPVRMICFLIFHVFVTYLPKFVKCRICFLHGKQFTCNENSMYRSALVDTLVTHANVQGFGLAS